MNCPYCAAKMEPGVVQSAREIFFTTKPHKYFFSSNAGEITLCRNKWTCPTCRAYHCPVCKKVVIDYSELSESMKDT